MFDCKFCCFVMLVWDTKKNLPGLTLTGTSTFTPKSRQWFWRRSLRNRSKRRVTLKFSLFAPEDVRRAASGRWLEDFSLFTLKMRADCGKSFKFPGEFPMLEASSGDGNANLTLRSFRVSFTFKCNYSMDQPNLPVYLKVCPVFVNWTPKLKAW